MPLLEVLLKTLEAGLNLWDDKEKMTYVNQLISLKKDYYEEFNKPLSDRSDARLDNIEFQLRVVAIGFAASAGKQNAAPVTEQAPV